MCDLVWFILMTKLTLFNLLKKILKLDNHQSPWVSPFGYKVELGFHGKLWAFEDMVNVFESCNDGNY